MPNTPPKTPTVATTPTIPTGNPLRVQQFTQRVLDRLDDIEVTHTPCQLKQHYTIGSNMESDCAVNAMADCLGKLILYTYQQHDITEPARIITQVITFLMLQFTQLDASNLYPAILTTLQSATVTINNYNTTIKRDNSDDPFLLTEAELILITMWLLSEHPNAFNPSILQMTPSEVHQILSMCGPHVW